jgi:pimeloyl-ACP methyl ester carboxylesterase
MHFSSASPAQNVMHVEQEPRTMSMPFLDIANRMAESKGPTRRSVLAFSSLALPGALLTEAPMNPVFAQSSAAAPPQPVPFKIDIPDAVLARVRQRIANLQWPQASRGAGWRYGVDADWFKRLVSYWRDTYDWRAAEAALNRTPQYLVDIDGRKVHFARLAPPSGQAAGPPLLLLHGWPYTFAAMLPLAEKLAHDGFEVVVPSLPGYAFSEAPDKEIRGLRFISRRIDRLMTEALGHRRYLIHGGDFGAVVADWIAIDTPDHVAGIHAHMIAFRHAGAEYGSGQTGVVDATPEEAAYAKAEVENMARESAYFRLQFTRPETITYALTDSPVGWAAYMLDKWQKWTDTRDRGIDAIYGLDRLLTEVMLFAVTDTVATSIWPYAGFATEPFGLQPGQKIAVPFGYSSFPDPLLPRMPRRFVERSRTKITLWREHDKGGHLPMLEQTDVLANDLRDFAKGLG